MKYEIILLSALLLFSCHKTTKPTSADYSTILNLAYEKNTEKIRKIFSENVNLSDYQTNELLQYAVKSKYENLILMLIENGVDVNCKLNGKSILYYTIENGQYVFSAKLIEIGANPFEKDDRGYVIFGNAMKSKSTVLQKKIIDKLCEVESTDIPLIELSIARYNMPDEVFTYFIENVFKNYFNYDMVTFAVRELILSNKTDIIFDLLENEQIKKCLLKSKFHTCPINSPNCQITIGNLSVGWGLVVVSRSYQRTISQDFDV